jgi:hypothetical protein
MMARTQSGKSGEQQNEREVSGICFTDDCPDSERVVLSAVSHRVKKVHHRYLFRSWFSRQGFSGG